MLTKRRQIVSGLLAGTQKTLKFQILKEMNDADKLRLVKTDIWRNDHHFKVNGCYNPPNNDPDFCQIFIASRTIVMGDFNAHSSIWQT